jgi:hypothetical protein
MDGVLVESLEEDQNSSNLGLVMRRRRIASFGSATCLLEMETGM